MCPKRSVCFLKLAFLAGKCYIEKTTYCRQSRLSQFGYTHTDTDTASGEERGMIVFKVFGGRGTVGVRGMIVFKVFGGRGTVGVRGMTVFKVFGGRGTVGVRGMTVSAN